MGGSGKRITLFFIVLNILLFLSGLGGDMSIFGSQQDFTYTLNSTNTTYNVTGFGFDINSTSGGITPPTPNSLVGQGIFALIIGTAIVVAGLSILYRDPAYIFRSGMIIFLASLVALPAYTIFSMSVVPFQVKMILIVPMIIMGIFAMIDFMGGSDW